MTPALVFSDTSALSPNDDARLSSVQTAVPTVRTGGVLATSSLVTIPAAIAVTPTGLISPSQGIVTTGNAFPIVVQGNFGFSWDGTILSVYWDQTNGSAQFVVRRADKSQITIPRGSLRISGLKPDTQYGFVGYVAVAQAQTVSFVVGDAGSPRFAFSPDASTISLSLAAQQQKATVNESLTNGIIYFTTGAAGSASAGTGANAGTGTSPYSGQPSGGAGQSRYLPEPSPQ